MAVVAVQDLNKLIGISADIKASDMLVTLNPRDQGWGDDAVKVDMEVTFCWYVACVHAGAKQQRAWAGARGPVCG